MGKRIFVYLLVVLFILGMGCASKKNTPKKVDVNNLETSPSKTEIKTKEKSVDRFKISIKDKRTTLHIPGLLNINITTAMDGSTFELKFLPEYKKVPLPNPSGVIKGIFYNPSDGDKATSLRVELKQPCQFLLSRDRVKGVLEVTFVPSQVAQTVNKQSSAVNKIQKIDFLKNRKGNLIICFDTQVPLNLLPLKSEKNKMFIRVLGVNVVSNYEKVFRLDKFNTPIKSVFFQNKGSDLNIMLSTAERVPFNLDMIEGKSSLVFLTSDNFKREQTAEEKEKLKNDFEAQNDLPELNTILPGMKKKYTGKKISIDLQDADIEHVLRLITSVTDYNLIIDDDVTGKISLRLFNIPWDQALDLVLLQKNLGMVVRGNIMRIATQEKLQAEREALRRAREEAQKAKESMKKLEPLVREYIQINYTTAAEIEPKIKSFLSERGKVTSDSRTNQLIIEDTASNIQQIKAVIEKLDRPEKQVLIEARIVYATDEFKRALGVKWGAQNPGENFGQNNAYYKQYGVTTLNYPANAPASTITFTGELAKIAGKDLFTLDAELKLAETQNLAKTISSPRIVTLNNQAAEITQGTKIAVTAESESGGTTVEYKDAILKLSVTPQITPDNKIVLSLDISDDTPVPGGGGDIETKTAKTKLIVNDGETIVIGGVRKISTTEAQDRVPGLHKIPLLGWLFKNDYKAVTKQELLIFIRPKILE